jgi:NTE family protein
MPVPMTPLDMNTEDPAGDVTGLCLSGGGYRAMVFHAGSVYRMNELGLLRGLARVSSVSGGSMTAGALATAWPGLQWDIKGRASNLDGKFLKPLLRQARSSIDVTSALSRFNPFSSAARAAAESYDANITGGKLLAQLPKPPDAPLFIFNATSLMTGKAVRFRHDYIADYTIGVLEGLSVKISQAVAASAAFPPVLSPSILDVRGAVIRPGTQGPNAHGEMLRTWMLTDGGVYDNMGTETVWKQCRTVFVSNAGKPFEVDEQPPTDLFFQPLRVLDLIGAQSEDLRERILGHALYVGARNGAMWGLATGQNKPAQRPPLLTAEQYAAAQAVGTRLEAMDNATIALLLKAGYAHAAQQLRTWYGPAKGGVPDVPDGQWPEPFAT